MHQLWNGIAQNYNTGNKFLWNLAQIFKRLYECKSYSARQFITEFPDKRWTKNSINNEVKKVRNSRHVNKAVWRVIFVTFGDAI